MTAKEIAAWRKKLGLVQREAAARLGISRRSYQGYEAGAKIPKAIALACAALAHGLDNYSKTTKRK